MANDNARYFISHILPQASNRGKNWTLDRAQKAFEWSRHYPGKKGPVLLLEEFLRNPGIGEKDLLTVFKGMSLALDPDEFEESCGCVQSRKNIHQSAIALIQSDPEAVVSAQAAILKMDLQLQDPLPQRWIPLFRRVETAEMVLTFVADGDKDDPLDSSVARWIGTTLNGWMDSGSDGWLVGTLLAVPVALSRRILSIHGDTLLPSWLRMLDRLAGLLIPEEPERDCGLWFSFDQLARHVRSLLSSSSAGSIDPDRVTMAVGHFLNDKWRTADANCSIWLQIQLRL